MHLDGVTDEWIEKTEVKKVAGGQVLPPLDAATVSSIIESRRRLLCKEAGDQVTAAS